MTAPVESTGAPVIDTTSARERAAGRWRLWRWPISVAVISVGALLVLALLRPAPPQIPLHPENPASDGGRALARLLDRHGIDVIRADDAREALRHAGPGTTVLVLDRHPVPEDRADALAASGADLVLAGPDETLLGRLAPDLRYAWLTPSEEASTPREARCEDPDARAAGSLRSRGPGLRALGSDVVTCFPPPGAEAVDGPVGAYAVRPATTARGRLVVLDDPSLLSNDRLDEDGAAALALRALSHRPTLVWYLTEPDPRAGAGLGAVLPPQAPAVLLHLLLVALLAAVWRARRLGPLVEEPLPVVVRSAETVHGRGRLYRRARAHGHAAAALRAGTAHRIAGRLGLPSAAGRDTVLDALVHATGRSRAALAELLYGPPPATDAALTDLSHRLAQLENEVHGA